MTKRLPFLVAIAGLAGAVLAFAGPCCTLAAPNTTHGSGGHGGGQTVQSELPKPVLVQAVDTAKHAITFGRDGADPETYTYDNFTRIVVNGKAGKIEDIQTGMKVAVVGSSSTKKASRIDADTYVPPKTATTKKK